MRNRELPPCRGCTITVCEQEPDFYDEPYPVESCWERYEVTLFSTQSARHTPTEEET